MLCGSFLEMRQGITDAVLELEQAWVGVFVGPTIRGSKAFKGMQKHGLCPETGIGKL